MFLSRRECNSVDIVVSFCEVYCDVILDQLWKVVEVFTVLGRQYHRVDSGTFSRYHLEGVDGDIMENRYNLLQGYRLDSALRSMNQLPFRPLLDFW